MNQEDFVGAGFKKVEHFSPTPPKIKWGRLYNEKWDDGKKISYLEKLAAAMNHAAEMIQNERDELIELCEKKDAQVKQMEEAVRQNNDLLQQEITRINAQKNAAATEVSRLNARIRELENGDKH